MSDLSPLCFVLMPFQKKRDATGGPDIDFDRIYRQAIEPAVIAAGLTPIRGDQESAGGLILKSIYERLLLCEYAVADLTTANPNVYYELGVRHTARPRTTVTLCANHHALPFDIKDMRTIRYDLGAHNAFGDAEAAQLRDTLKGQLQQLRAAIVSEAPVDSPLFQLLSEWRPAPLSRQKTDDLRARAETESALGRRMVAARSLGKTDRGKALAELAAVRADLGSLDLDEVGSILDLYLSYRAVEAWDEMVALYDDMPVLLQGQVLVREQLGFALNRRASGKSKHPGDRERALQVLTSVEQAQGPSAETCGLMGRIHKDLWDEARAADPVVARGHLNRAIEAYRRGFHADMRDAYPGINLATLLEVRGDAESLREKLMVVPVVRYAVERRLVAKSPDYWDHATRLELAVLGDDEEAASEALSEALASVRERWEPKTTLRNLRLIEEVRRARGESVAGIAAIIAALARRVGD
ncbi:MAG: TRAFs-binding domain-containing protein [Planctomycetota bacterium]